MDLTNYRNIWVFIEQDESGKPKNVGLELLSECRRLADAASYELWAVAIGADNGEICRIAGKYGADKVLSIEDSACAYYNADRYGYIMEALVRKHKPSVIMIGATNNGRDLGPKVSTALATGLTADCTQLEINENGLVTWIRPALGGNLMGHINCPDTRPQMGTVRPGVFKKTVFFPDKKATVLRETIVIPNEKMRMQTIDVVKNLASDKVKIEDANVVICGGRGLGKGENFALLKDLADALGGVVAGTRKATDAGWISLDEQVGQTGKTVSPDLFIAVGLSGAIQHQVGMNGSGTIVAINIDKNAPIFDIATYGIVGDLFEVVPALTEAIKARKSCNK